MNNIKRAKFHKGKAKRGNRRHSIPIKADIKKAELAKNIRKININSPVVNVKISSSDISEVEVHFYGQANITGNVDFSVSVKNQELVVTLKLGAYKGELILDIVVPNEKEFEKICVSTSKKLMQHFLRLKFVRIRDM